MLFAISDLHLGFAVHKPMEQFGEIWKNHTNKIKENWLAGNDDITICPGDLSWGLKPHEVMADLQFLEELSGKKILLKGNHDIWWNSNANLEKLLIPFSSISYVQNNSIILNDIGICGTRGWDIRLLEEKNQKIIRREKIRLQLSIDSCEAKEKIVFMHYPPVLQETNLQQVDFSDVLIKNNIKRVFYGHVHGNYKEEIVSGLKDGIHYTCVAADQINFKPILIQQ